MSDQIHDIHDQSHAYAVGALPDDEATQFEAHLETCADCRQEVAALGDVTAALSDSVAVDPPPGLRAAVLTEIAQTPQEPAAEAREQPGGDVVTLRRSRLPLVSGLVAAAAVIAAVVFGGIALNDRQDARDAQAQTSQLTSLLSADDVQTVPGVSHDAGHPGSIVMSKNQGVAIFVASELPSLPNDKVYEAWTIHDGDKPVPAGTFTPQDSRSMVRLPQATFDATTMAITVEPAGGSDAPTSDAVVTFVMPQA